MAIAAAFVWEVRTDGNDANGGGFKTGATGTDYSQQASPQVTIDGATITAVVHTTTTQLNVTGYTVAAADVGNCVNVNGGTATAGRYEITAVDTGNNRWTLDRAVGTAAQTATGRMGGALATPGMLGKILSTASQGANYQTAWIKSGTYTLTTSAADSGGKFLNSARAYLRIEGYETTRGDLGAKPVLNAGAQTSIYLWTEGYGEGNYFVNLGADGNSQSGVSGFFVSTLYGVLVKCSAVNCSSSGIGFAAGQCIECLVTNCTTGFLNSNSSYCVASGCYNGFSISSMRTTLDCIAYDCTNVGFYVTTTCLVANCTSYSNTSHGFHGPNSGGGYVHYANCVSVSNGGKGFANDTGTAYTVRVGCAEYGNATASDSVRADLEPITLSGDPFQDGAAGDFRLNNTAGAGALLRGLGIGPVGQTNARDIGAVQVASGGSSGGSRLVGQSGLVGRSF